MTKTTVWHIFIGYRARQHLMLSFAIFWHECFNHEWLYTNINWCTRIWAHSVSFSAATTVKRSDSVESFICMNYTSSVRACLFMRAACLTHAYTHTATPFSTVIGSSPEASAPSALWDMSRCFQPCTFFFSFWISVFISPFFLLGLHHCSLLCVIAAQEQHPTSSFYISASSIFFSVHPSQGDSPHSRLFLTLSLYLHQLVSVTVSWSLYQLQGPPCEACGCWPPSFHTTNPIAAFCSIHLYRLIGLDQMTL